MNNTVLDLYPSLFPQKFAVLQNEKMVHCSKMYSIQSELSKVNMLPFVNFDVLWIEKFDNTNLLSS